MARSKIHNFANDVHTPRFVPSTDKEFTDFAVWKNEIIKRGWIVHTAATETIVEALDHKRTVVGTFDMKLGTGEIK